MHLWSLGGDSPQQFICKKTILNGSSPEGVHVVGLEYFEPLDAFILMQEPAIAHIFASRDLHLLLPPASLHSRKISCHASCHSKSEMIIACVDGRILIFTLSTQTVMKKDDSSSCSERPVVEYRVKCRIGWSIGAACAQLNAFVIDENFHNLGFRIFGAVQSDVMVWSWETGALLFKIQECHGAGLHIASIQLRQDTPVLFTAAEDRRIKIWSLRDVSRGKLLETLEGHEFGISAIRMHHACRILYSIDQKACIKCWDTNKNTEVNEMRIVEEDVDKDNENENMWSRNEVVPSDCSLEIADIDGNCAILCRSPKHHQYHIEILKHRRFVAQCENPVFWMRCIRSRSLLALLGGEIASGLSSPKQTESPHEYVILALSENGILQVIHATSGTSLMTMDLRSLHEIFLRGEIAEPATTIAKTKNRIRLRKKRNIPAFLTDAEIKQRQDAIVKEKIDAYRLKSGNYSDDQLQTIRDKSEALRKSVKALKLKARLESARDIGSVSICEYVDHISHGLSSGSALFILWSGGSLDLISLETQECIQVYEDAGSTEPKSTSFAWYPESSRLDGPIFVVTASTTNFAKVWSSTAVHPASVKRKFRATEPEDGPVVSLSAAKQYDTSLIQHHFLFILTESSILTVCAGYSWIPIVRVNLCERTTGGPVRPTCMELYSPTVILFGFTDGSLQAWRASLDTKQAQKVTGCLLERMWPHYSRSNQESALFESGRVSIVQCQPHRSKFLSKSDTLGLLEYCVLKDNDDGIKITLGDQLSRDSDPVSRTRGIGDLLQVECGSYLDICHAVAVAVGREINFLSTCDYHAIEDNAEFSYDEAVGLDQFDCNNDRKAIKDLALEFASELNNEETSIKHSMETSKTAGLAVTPEDAEEDIDAIQTMVEETLIQESRHQNRKNFARRLTHALEAEKEAAQRSERERLRQDQESAVLARIEDINKFSSLGLIPTGFAVHFSANLQNAIDEELAFEIESTNETMEGQIPVSSEATNILTVNQRDSPAIILSQVENVLSIHQNLGDTDLNMASSDTKTSSKPKGKSPKSSAAVSPDGGDESICSRPHSPAQTDPVSTFSKTPSSSFASKRSSRGRSEGITRRSFDYGMFGSLRHGIPPHDLPWTSIRPSDGRLSDTLDLSLIDSETLTQNLSVLRTATSINNFFKIGANAIACRPKTSSANRLHAPLDTAFDVGVKGQRARSAQAQRRDSISSVGTTSKIPASSAIQTLQRSIPLSRQACQNLPVFGSAEPLRPHSAADNGVSRLRGDSDVSAYADLMLTSESQRQILHEMEKDILDYAGKESSPVQRINRCTATMVSLNQRLSATSRPPTSIDPKRRSIHVGRLALSLQHQNLGLDPHESSESERTTSLAKFCRLGPSFVQRNTAILLTRALAKSRTNTCEPDAVERALLNAAGTVSLRQAENRGHRRAKTPLPSSQQTVSNELDTPSPSTRYLAALAPALQMFGGRLHSTDDLDLPQ